MNSHSKRWSILGAAALLCGSAISAFARPLVQGDERVYDKIVGDFIRFDTGQIRDPLAIEQIKFRFNGLKTDDAVPSLVRGLNASTRMRASCPITALSSKLRGIVSSSKNPEVGTYVLQHLDRLNAGPYAGYVNTLFDVAETQVVRTTGRGLAEQQFKQRAEEDSQRLAYTPGLKLTDLASREVGESSVSDGSRENNRAPAKRPNAARSNVARSNGRDGAAAAPTTDSDSTSTPAAIDWTKLRMEELAERLGDRASQVRALAELSRRASAGEDAKVAEAAPAIVQCLTDGDESARASAARLLGLVRSPLAIEPLIEALDDSNGNVRSAAATALTRITRQLFGPNDDATPEERRLAVARWRDWLNRQRKGSERAAGSVAR